MTHARCVNPPQVRTEPGSLLWSLEQQQQQQDFRIVGHQLGSDWRCARRGGYFYFLVLSLFWKRGLCTLTLGFILLLTPGGVRVKDAREWERERERERGGRSRQPFPGHLNLWKQVYFRCISASQDVSAAFEVHIPVSVPHLRFFLSFFFFFRFAH